MTVTVGPLSGWSVVVLLGWVVVVAFFWLLFFAYGRNRNSGV